MKKIFLYILAGSLSFTACKKDDDYAVYIEPSDVNVQNSYDDQAIKKFMDENYLDVQGNIKPFSATDTADDHQKKLSELKPQTLPSGTIYILRDGAQPAPGKGKEIKDSSVIKIMGRINAYEARDNNGSPKFVSITPFLNTIDGSTLPSVDPMYYYSKTSVRTASGKDRSYYEIAGLKEALQKFTSFDNLPSDAPYNLQGVIIVPSRAAFGRNAYYPYLGGTYRNNTFVVNFQIYDSRKRLSTED